MAPHAWTCRSSSDVRASLPRRDLAAANPLDDPPDWQSPGDTGVFVWNIWMFRHELIRHAQWPFITDHIFAATNGADLSAHNYTVFADVLALPLIGRLGVVGSFNLIYLFLIASSGYATFVLVKRLVGTRIEALIAGAVFAASPVLIARGTATSVWSRPRRSRFFFCPLCATLRTGRLRDASWSAS